MEQRRRRCKNDKNQSSISASTPEIVSQLVVAAKVEEGAEYE